MPRKPDEFRFQGRQFQLTYCGWRSKEEIIAKVESKIKKYAEWVMVYSIVHETSDAECPYNHTHAALVDQGGGAATTNAVFVASPEAIVTARCSTVPRLEGNGIFLWAS